MKKWVCNVCGWIYDEEAGDPDNGLAAGVAFADLPDDFVCPLCGVGKDEFSEEAQNAGERTANAGLSSFLPSSAFLMMEDS